VKLVFHGQRLRGEFSLIKLKGPRATGKEWLLIKKADAEADPNFRVTTALTPAKRRQLTETIPPCETS
jgi:hypothetical protein